MTKLNLAEQNISLKASAFTLIELMIVMGIVSLLIALVGPMAIQNLEKAQAKSELLTVKNWLRKISYRSYVSGQELELSLQGKLAQLKTIQPSIVIKQQEFEYLFFQPQSLYFNSKGFVSPSQLSATYRDKPLNLDLASTVNFDYEKQNLQ